MRIVASRPLLRTDRLYYSRNMKRLMLEDMSNFQEVALYHGSDEPSVEKARRDDVMLSFLLEFGKDYGWNTHLYLDCDIKSRSTRPELHMMMEHARERRFELVLCESFAYLGTGRETLGILDTLSEWHVQCCSINTLFPFVGTKLAGLALTELHDLITAGEFDPKYTDAIVTICRAVRALQSEKIKRSIREARQQGKNIGRPPRKREAIMPLLKARKSIPAIRATVNASLSTIYRAEQDLLKSSRASSKPEIAADIDSAAICTKIH